MRVAAGCLSAVVALQSLVGMVPRISPHNYPCYQLLSLLASLLYKHHATAATKATTAQPEGIGTPVPAGPLSLGPFAAGAQHPFSVVLCHVHNSPAIHDCTAVLGEVGEGSVVQGAWIEWNALSTAVWALKQLQ